MVGQGTPHVIDLLEAKSSHEEAEGVMEVSVVSF